METEVIDKLFLELSQFTTATTKKELELLVLIDRLGKVIRTVDNLKASSHSIDSLVIALVNEVKELRERERDLTPEEADKAFDDAPAEPISEADIDRYVAFLKEIDRLKKELARASDERLDAMRFFNASEKRRGDLLKSVKELLTIVMPKDCTADGIVERAHAMVRTEEGG